MPVGIPGVRPGLSVERLDHEEGDEGDGGVGVDAGRLLTGIVYKSYFARGGGLGGWVFSQVAGSKALDPPPLIIPRVSWVGLLPHLLSLVTGALSGCLLVPLSAQSLCKWQVCRWQFFRWQTFF